MASHGLFIGFGFPVRGREQTAAKVFNEMVQYLTGQIRQGTVESIEPVFLQAHGGDLGGFIIVRGDRAKVDAMVATDEFQRNLLRAQLAVEGIGAVNCMLGDEIQKNMGMFLDAVKEMA